MLFLLVGQEKSTQHLNLIRNCIFLVECLLASYQRGVDCQDPLRPVGEAALLAFVAAWYVFAEFCICGRLVCVCLVLHLWPLGTCLLAKIFCGRGCWIGVIKFASGLLSVHRCCKMRLVGKSQTHLDSNPLKQQSTHQR